MNFLKRIFTAIIFISLMFIPFTGNANYINEINIDNLCILDTVENTEIPSCRTWTIGINIGIFYMETSATICCLINIPPQNCWEIQRNKGDKNTFDISHILMNINKDNVQLISITSSSTEIFENGEMRIELGTYIINEDETITLRYDFEIY
jgi:hypothetical protein